MSEKISSESAVPSDSATRKAAGDAVGRSSMAGAPKIQNSAEALLIKILASGNDIETLKEWARSYFSRRGPVTLDTLEAEAEIRLIDSILARRPALDDLPTRWQKIETAIAVAKTADECQAKLDVLHKMIARGPSKGWLLAMKGGDSKRYIGVRSGMLAWGSLAEALHLARREDADKLAEIVDDADEVLEKP